MLFRKLIPALLWALFILILCGLPGNDIPRLTFLDWMKPDKIVHLVLFGTLSFLLIKAFVEQTTYPSLIQRAKLLSIIIASIYGVVIEVLQETIFIGRTGDVFDALADSVGAFIGLWFFNYWTKRKAAKPIS